jgi:hypothetical protein
MDARSGTSALPPLPVRERSADKAVSSNNTLFIKDILAKGLFRVRIFSVLYS